ncbi:cation:proton antiporter [Erythrobacter sp. HL-111]|uniref:cation:proton antiporter domain-containing protein n=1 Tax=Erythrobacter sp. HL-111 TaxID=1798193 RepID=UPI0006DBB97C|nr:cation:proton antiporter [Erythrobacter sp. HL-111]KPP94992.1 MAG: monovalent cation:H+ antiporter-2, CPA2 family [Erythrobacteraceae bacterium HL-111]SDS12980.1 Kef-type potassium/proton antiporter, CPA2 family [Erythrobacter sp. HL-111]
MAGELTLSPVMSDALVILGSAGIVIPVFARFRVTPIIGFILIGILVGPYGLGMLVEDVPWLRHVTISDSERLAPFADFGIILLLFAIGLELSFNRLWQLRKLVFGLGSLELLIIGTTSALFFGYASEMDTTAAIALGFALAFSSTAIVLPISGTSSPVGRAALSMLLFEDIMIVPIIFILGALAPNAEGGWSAITDTLWQGALVIGMLLVLGRVALPHLFSQAARTKSPELFLAASLLVVIGASLATSAVGLSPIVGALIAGLLIAETEYHGEVESIMEPFKGLALGVFLITIGMSIDLMAIWSDLGTIMGAVVAVLVFKAIVTGVLLRLMGARRSTATETGVLMASPSETTLIVLAAATSALVIDPETAQFWQIVTAIGLTITPLLAKLGRVVARRVDGVQEVLESDGEDEPHTIIIGGGRVGRLIADMMTRHGKAYVMLDSDPDLISRARREGYRAVFGDAGRGDALARLGVEHAPAVVLTMDEPVLAQRLVAKLRGEYPDLLIVARARDSEHAAALYRSGASHAVPENLESSLQLSEAVLVDIGVAMGPVIASIHEKRDEFRERIEREGGLSRKPALRTTPSSSPGLAAGADA